MTIQNIFLTSVCVVRLALSCGVAASHEPESPGKNETVESALALPYIMSDGMILQQESEVAIYGTDDRGVKVAVSPSWSDRSFETITGSDGRWIVKIKTPKGSNKSYTIKITDSNKGEKIIRDVLVGEVWLCSGQSNMEHPMKGFSASEPVQDSEKELSDSDYPQFRYFKVPRDVSRVPRYDTGESSWKSSSRDNAKDFEAIAFFFGRRIHKALGVPVGIIGCAYGGSRIEGWMPPESFTKLAKNEYMDSDKLSEGENSASAPSNCWNAMLLPVMDYGFRGFLWFQGESNCNYYWSYSHLLQVMVSDWRARKGDSSARIPFYFAQLAPWVNNRPITNSGSELLRNAQMTASKAIPNCGIIGLSDAGSENTIHFPNKMIPAERFALWALYNEYGDKKVNPMGPAFSSMRSEGGKLLVSISDASGLHVVDGVDNVPYAEISGDGKNFVPANVRILSGGILEFSSSEVASPTAARYCYSGWHVGTIFNSAGLPLFPFRASL